MTHWKSLTRWLLLPFGTVITYLLIGGINMLIFRDYRTLPEENIFLMVFKGLIHYAPSYLIAGIAAIYVGISIAPSKKRTVAIVLGSIIATILVALIAINAYAFELGKIERGPFYCGLFQNIGGLIGVIFGAVAVSGSGDYN